MFKFSSRSSRVSTAAAAAAKTRRSVASPQQPDWIALRRKERPQDLELAPHAVRWWHALPADARPVHLVQRFPRIVNLLAQCWDDPRLVRETFESLLHDQRGGRQGFPSLILSELRRLREFSLQQAPQAAATAPAAPRARPPVAGSLPALPKLSEAWDMHWELASDH